MRNKSKKSRRNKSSSNKNHCSCTENKYFIKTWEFNTPSTGPDQTSTMDDSRCNFTSMCFAWNYILCDYCNNQMAWKCITIKNVQHVCCCQKNKKKKNQIKMKGHWVIAPYEDHYNGPVIKHIWCNCTKWSFCTKYFHVGHSVVLKLHNMWG